MGIDVNLVIPEGAHVTELKNLPKVGFLSDGKSGEPQGKNEGGNDL